ncbi:MAG: MipA/OmpV family protein [Sphingomonas sp.]|uniref:MipA/OmpV family protein n=1 Tax=Sphingomonas sp. TaxID=28214 RepID=UPI0022752CE3|nr:MipA/OmpV family protein [Sphingomonas sp.]MCX8475362.1 MipA/OmpV family protein [Sphingomonas sp.]
MYACSPPQAAALRGLAALLACCAPLAAQAQVSEPNADPAELPDAPPPPGPPDRQLQVGLFTAYTPAFLGSKDYQLIAGPNIQLRYDRISLSLQDGLGFDVIRGGGWRVGPSIGLRQSRQQDGDSPLRIAGDRSDALLGLGTIKASADVGGYVAWESGPIGARLDVRQATNSDLGLIATLGLRYTAMIPTSSAPRARPAIFSIGPRLSFVDDKYNQAYFGVTAAQSARSGLSPYRAEGGLLSAGVGAVAIVPLSEWISGMLIGAYDRLAGDAARSPLVEERGSRNQATVALGLSYRFGL